MAKIAFYHGPGTTWWKTIQTLLVIIWTGGKISHVELVDTKNTTDMSRWDWYAASAYEQGEVRIKKGFIPKRNKTGKFKHWSIYDLDAFDETRAFDFITSQLGKKYDWKAIFLTQFIHINKQDKSKWFCSEIIRAALAYAGVIEDDKKHHQYSPNDFYKELIDKKIIS